MKRMVVIVFCIFALLAGNSLGAHAMHLAEGDKTELTSMSGHHSIPTGLDEHRDAHCCVISMEHCNSVLLRTNGGVHFIRFTKAALSPHLNNLAMAKFLPEVVHPPPRA